MERIEMKISSGLEVVVDHDNWIGTARVSCTDLKTGGGYTVMIDSAVLRAIGACAIRDELTCPHLDIMSLGDIESLTVGPSRRVSVRKP